MFHSLIGNAFGRICLDTDLLLILFSFTYGAPFFDENKLDLEHIMLVTDGGRCGSTAEIGTLL